MKAQAALMRVAAQVDQATYEELGRFAVRNDRSLAAELRRAVREHLHSFAGSVPEGGASDSAAGLLARKSAER